MGGISGTYNGDWVGGIDFGFQDSQNKIYVEEEKAQHMLAQNMPHPLHLQHTYDVKIMKHEGKFRLFTKGKWRNVW